MPQTFSRDDALSSSTSPAFDVLEPAVDAAAGTRLKNSKLYVTTSHIMSSPRKMMIFSINKKCDTLVGRYIDYQRM